MAQFSLQEAAVRLGITEDAVRMRLKRGTLQGEKANGRWVVIIDESNAPNDVPPNKSPNSSPNEAQLLIARLEAEIAFLREECQRKDHIIMALSQKIPALPSPDPAVAETTVASAGKRPWWWPWGNRQATR